MTSSFTRIARSGLAVGLTLLLVGSGLILAGPQATASADEPSSNGQLTRPGLAGPAAEPGASGGEEMDTITVGSQPLTPIVANDLIWVPNGSDGTVSVIDPAGPSVIDTITAGAAPATPIVANGFIWVPHSPHCTVSVIDLAGPCVLGRVGGAPVEGNRAHQPGEC